MVNNVDIIIVVCAIGQLDSVYMVSSASILVPAYWLLSIYYLTNHSTFVRDNILNIIQVREMKRFVFDNEMALAVKGRSLKMTLNDYGEPTANRGHDPSQRNKNRGGRRG
ncbi:hypothetical protein POTOM_034371 [Populus tomentosa]|uniref:Uncharacterized protein n=1 Tax=Populus tomentosa TaxID=118781 RepID=A0A8X7YYK4_POPTO|nr:hypothetical protein POTOM_034371 [Populus tomentosa]